MASRLKYKTTADIKVSKKIVDQVIGQQEAVNIIKKAALQRRHVFLIGSPGTGKSMLGMALAELMPKEKLVDTLSFFNPNDENAPLIRTVPAGQGRNIVAESRVQGASSFKTQSIILFILVIISMIVPWWARSYYNSDIMFAAFFIGGMMFLAAFILYLNMGKRMGAPQGRAPKIIVDNYKKKQAPFFDATGSHAGALLGDVLHDPFQSFSTTQKLQLIEGNCVKNVNISQHLDSLFSKHKDKIHRQGNYEAIHLEHNEFLTLGEEKGLISPVEVLSANRYDYDGHLVKLTTKEGRNLVLTPEHKIAVSINGNIKYVESSKLKPNMELVVRDEDIILDVDDIINTYDERQQEQCKLFYQYQEIKKNNPTWGYKRIAKAMGQKEGKTRWWHANKHIPVPIQTVNWLKEKGIIPLKADNPKLPIIAKITGATFGEGGIFENLNGIFLSSSELSAVKEFGKDIEGVFDLKEGENSRIIEGGEFGHSLCYQNTNRNIIRFFIALGAPKGNKSSVNLIMPPWTKLNEEWEDQFYGSFFGSEIGIPKVHTSKIRLNTFDIAITGTSKTTDNRRKFLLEIKEFLEGKGVKVNSLLSRKTKTKGVLLNRLIFSVTVDNLISFLRNLKMNYCQYKKEKLVNTLNEFMRIKAERYNYLIGKGYGAETCMKKLQITPSSLYEILNNKKFVLKEAQT